MPTTAKLSRKAHAARYFGSQYTALSYKATDAWACSTGFYSLDITIEEKNEKLTKREGDYRKIQDADRVIPDDYTASDLLHAIDKTIARLLPIVEKESRVGDAYFIRIMPPQNDEVREVYDTNSLLACFADLPEHLSGISHDWEPVPAGKLPASEARKYLKGFRRWLVGELPKLPTGSQGKVKKEWYHDKDEEPPPTYKHGSLQGTKRHLGICLGGNANSSNLRTLEQKATSGVVWVRRLGWASFEAFFRRQIEYAEASKIKLQHEHQNSPSR